MNDPASVLILTSHVIRGRIGVRGAAFAIERLGFPAWIMPTVTLPFHPGYGPSTRTIPSTEEFFAQIDELIKTPWLKEVGAVLTGYLGNAEQATAIARLVKAVRSENPDLLYCCDPVIGDHDGLYVKEEIATAIRDELVPIADLITPNRFEFDWLTGKVHSSNEYILVSAGKLNAPQIAVTSAFAHLKSSQAVLFYERGRDDALLAEHRAFGKAPNGTGDLFAGLLTARLLQKLKPEKALEAATASVFDVLNQTIRHGDEELRLVEEQSRIERPMVPITMRRISGTVVKSKGVRLKPKPLIG